jgi:ADYC domain/Pentapeptide repeats (8 copies)
MVNLRSQRIGVLAVCTFFTAVAAADVVPNGTNLNGTNLNGTNLNGTNLNGTNLNGTSLSGVSLNGALLRNLHLEGAQLVGQDGNGTRRAGADLIGAQLTGTLDNGAPLGLQIADVIRGTAPNDDLYYYSVVYQHADGSWESLCANGGTPSLAIPMAGRWSYAQGTAGGGAHIDDASSFTFACQGGAVAKCAEWGYKPWRSVNGKSLAGYHQTCTRVVRADYCGDGTPHTQNGQTVNLYDDVGVQDDTRLWLGEASWDENGARAYNLLNRSHLDLLYRLGCGVPLRLLFDGNWEFSHGARIVTETPLGSDL